MIHLAIFDTSGLFTAEQNPACCTNILSSREPQSGSSDGGIDTPSTSQQVIDLQITDVLVRDSSSGLSISVKSMVDGTQGTSTQQCESDPNTESNETEYNCENTSEFNKNELSHGSESNINENGENVLVLGRIELISQNPGVPLEEQVGGLQGENVHIISIKDLRNSDLDSKGNRLAGSQSIHETGLEQHKETDVSKVKVAKESVRNKREAYLHNLNTEKNTAKRDGEIVDGNEARGLRRSRRNQACKTDMGEVADESKVKDLEKSIVNEKEACLQNVGLGSETNIVRRSRRRNVDANNTRSLRRSVRGQIPKYEAALENNIEADESEVKDAPESVSKTNKQYPRNAKLRNESNKLERNGKQIVDTDDTRGQRRSRRNQRCKRETGMEQCTETGKDEVQCIQERVQSNNKTYLRNSSSGKKNQVTRNRRQGAYTHKTRVGRPCRGQIFLYETGPKQDIETNEDKVKEAQENVENMSDTYMESWDKQTSKGTKNRRENPGTHDRESRKRSSGNETYVRKTGKERYYKTCEKIEKQESVQSKNKTCASNSKNKKNKITRNRRESACTYNTRLQTRSCRGQIYMHSTGLEHDIKTNGKEVKNVQERVQNNRNNFLTILRLDNTSKKVTRNDGNHDTKGHKRSISGQISEHDCRIKEDILSVKNEVKNTRRNSNRKLARHLGLQNEKEKQKVKRKRRQSVNTFVATCRKGSGNARACMSDTGLEGDLVTDENDVENVQEDMQKTKNSPRNPAWKRNKGKRNRENVDAKDTKDGRQSSRGQTSKIEAGINNIIGSNMEADDIPSRTGRTRLSKSEINAKHNCKSTLVEDVLGVFNKVKKDASSKKIKGIRSNQAMGKTSTGSKVSDGEIIERRRSNRLILASLNKEKDRKISRESTELCGLSAEVEGKLNRLEKCGGNYSGSIETKAVKTQMDQDLVQVKIKGRKLTKSAESEKISKERIRKLTRSSERKKKSHNFKEKGERLNKSTEYIRKPSKRSRKSTTSSKTNIKSYTRKARSNVENVDESITFMKNKNLTLNSVAEETDGNYSNFAACSNQENYRKRLRLRRNKAVDKTCPVGGCWICERTSNSSVVNPSGIKSYNQESRKLGIDGDIPPKSAKTKRKKCKTIERINYVTRCHQNEGGGEGLQGKKTRSGNGNKEGDLPDGLQVSPKSQRPKKQQKGYTKTELLEEDDIESDLIQNDSSGSVIDTGEGKNTVKSWTQRSRSSRKQGTEAGLPCGKKSEISKTKDGEKHKKIRQQKGCKSQQPKTDKPQRVLERTMRKQAGKNI